MDDNFMFGVATAAYQIEGAPFEDGKTASIWDTFSHEKGRIKNDENADVACDHYHHYKEDVELIAQLGVDTYRFSISWPRIFPRRGEYNPAGMEFYRNLLLELQKNDIKASVTLFHWDLPQWCEDLGGWTNRAVCTEFLRYCEKCFTELDALVDRWITVNEPMCIAELGYDIGCFAPGRKSKKDFLLAWHHIALSHGLAVRRYHELGLVHPIGIALNTKQMAPYTRSLKDRRAAQFAAEALDGWYLSPLFRGCYPEAGLRYYAQWAGGFGFIHKNDLETISEPIDFVGLNYYQEQYIRYEGETENEILFQEIPTQGKKTMLNWNITPTGIERLVQNLRKYTDLPVIITENGSAWRDVIDTDGKIHDNDRIDYLLRHLDAVDAANRKGLNIQGYFVWSLLDNFEWASGFEPRFGLVYMDYATGTRIPKDSYYVYKKYISEVRHKRLRACCCSVAENAKITR